MICKTILTGENQCKFGERNLGYFKQIQRTTKEIQAIRDVLRYDFVLHCSAIAASSTRVSWEHGNRPQYMSCFTCRKNWYLGGVKQAILTGVFFYKQAISTLSCLRLCQ
jgi:hypothetical protein